MLDRISASDGAMIGEKRQGAPLMIRRLLCILIVLIAANAAAQEAEPGMTPEGGGSAGCGSCHLDVVAAWLETPHQRAFASDAFQQAWTAARQPTDCLTCHVTGLVRRTGTFAYASVSCTACHGETPANHPREPIAVDPGPGVCADCHQTTFTDWEHSAHHESVACSDCHTVHPHGLLAETADALCLSCHTDPLTSHVHTSHSETETACIDCHYHGNAIGPQHVVDGTLLPTGHDNRVMPAACMDCHEALDPDWQTVRVASVSEPVSPPQTPIHHQFPLTQLLMGLALGSGLGVIIAALIFTRRRG
jgi:cytochrome c-type protein NrfB